MEPARAKELLRAIHDCEDSGCEEECEAACAMLEADPELQEWYEQEFGALSEMDQEVAEKFGCCKAPEEEEEICKGMCAARRGVLSFVLPALGAAALLLAGFFLFGGFGEKVEPMVVESSGRGLGALRSDMATFVGSPAFAGLHHKGEEFGDLTNWLVSQNSPAGEVRGCIACKEGVGCAVLSWSEEKVSMVCFRDEACGGGGLVHMFIVDRGVIEGEGIEAEVAETVHHSGLATRGWTNGDKVYLMVGDQPEVSLDGLLTQT